MQWAVLLCLQWNSAYFPAEHFLPESEKEQQVCFIYLLKVTNFAQRGNITHNKTLAICEGYFYQLKVTDFAHRGAWG
ncbi:hypothetical protein DRF60_20740 [Chryseobacterium elymi]|uniref:Uncharacterized protein n=1 Tax=Chryseobacterium elymi TaxID=395936 RepID=A0A3D9CZA7_9FLAO|nr:hypothetical protein DRF60_20740 [Chryseobacterium elymi]